MFKLDYKITINNIRFNGVASVKTKRSLTSLGGSATIVVPATAVLKQTDGSRLNVLTAQQVKRGDPVEVELGYNGKLKKEFSGFVKRVNYTRPLEIECEDAVFLLRDKKVKKSYTKSDNATIEKVIRDIIAGTNITLETGGLDIPIESLLLATKSGEEVPAEEALNHILDVYGLVGFFNTSQTLFVGLRYGKRLGEVKYRLGWNTIKDDELKYHNADDMKVKVKAVYFTALGKKEVREIGDGDGSVRTIHLTGVKDAAKIDELAKNELDKWKFNGFSGKITAFLEPYAEVGSIISIQDEKYPERAGNYYCEGTEVTFGAKGARRIIELGAKL